MAADSDIETPPHNLDSVEQATSTTLYRLQLIEPHGVKRTEQSIMLDMTNGIVLNHTLEAAPTPQPTQPTTTDISQHRHHKPTQTAPSANTTMATSHNSAISWNDALFFAPRRNPTLQHSQLDDPHLSTFVKVRKYFNKLERVLRHPDVLHLVPPHLPTLGDQLKLIVAFRAGGGKVNLLLDGAVADEVAAMRDSMLVHEDGEDWRDLIESYAEGIRTLDTYQLMSIDRSTWCATITHELIPHAKLHTFYQSLLQQSQRAYFRLESYCSQADLINQLRQFPRPWWASCQVHAQVHMVFVELQARRDDQWLLDMTALLAHTPDITQQQYREDDYEAEILSLVWAHLVRTPFRDAWKKELGALYDGAERSTWCELLELLCGGNFFEYAQNFVDLDHWWEKWCSVDWHQPLGLPELYLAVVFDNGPVINVETLAYFLHCGAESFFFSLLTTWELSQRLSAYLAGQDPLKSSAKKRIHIRCRLDRKVNLPADLLDGHDDIVIGDHDWQIPEGIHYTVSAHGTIVVEELQESTIDEGMLDVGADWNDLYDFDKLTALTGISPFELRAAGDMDGSYPAGLDADIEDDNQSPTIDLSDLGTMLLYEAGFTAFQRLHSQPEE